MPRLVQEELVGYGLNVMQGQRPVVKDGMPMFNGAGEPKTEPMWVLQFRGMKPDGDVHIVQVGLTKEAKDQVVQALTGVQIAGLDGLKL